MDGVPLEEMSQHFRAGHIIDSDDADPSAARRSQNETPDPAESVDAYAPSSHSKALSSLRSSQNPRRWAAFPVPHKGVSSG